MLIDFLSVLTCLLVRLFDEDPGDDLSPAQAARMEESAGELRAVLTSYRALLLEHLGGEQASLDWMKSLPPIE